MNNIGIALSGGGARGAAHIGVLQALNENDIFPDHISGASAGALIGALYCNGYSPLEILELSKEHSFLRIFKIGIMNQRLTDMSRLKKFLYNHIEDEFEKLNVSFYLSVTNLNSGKFEIKSSGPLIDYIAASCAIPLVFHPLAINGNMYVDGGVLNNLPVEPLLKRCDAVCGVSVSDHQVKDKIAGRAQTAQRCMQLAIWNNVEHRLKMCDIALEIPNAFGYGMFAFQKSEELFKIGYNETIKRMPEILKKFRQNR